MVVFGWLIVVEKGISELADMKGWVSIVWLWRPSGAFGGILKIVFVRLAGSAMFKGTVSP